MQCPNCRASCASPYCPHCGSAIAPRAQMETVSVSAAARSSLHGSPTSLSIAESRGRSVSTFPIAQDSRIHSVATGIESLDDPLLGQKIGDYQIESKLGKGGMGAVYLATHIKLQRKTAIKIVPPERITHRAVMERFRREAQALAAFQHPRIVPIYDMFQVGSLFCIAMGYCPKGSVRGLIENRGPLPEAMATRLLREAAEGLFVAAQKGIVHRDVKPDNLLLNDEFGVMIADFGLVKALDEESDAAFAGHSSMTLAGSVVGTPGYMPPEQWLDSRQVDHRSDLYSLGCTFYAMLAGRLPFDGPTAGHFMQQHLNSPTPDIRERRPEISPGVAAILRRMMDKAPERRFQSGAEVVQAIDALAAGSSAGATPPAQAGATPALLPVFAHRRPISGEFVAAPSGAPSADSQGYRAPASTDFQRPLHTETASDGGSDTVPDSALKPPSFAPLVINSPWREPPRPRRERESSGVGWILLFAVMLLGFVLFLFRPWEIRIIEVPGQETYNPGAGTTVIETTIILPPPPDFAPSGGESAPPNLGPIEKKKSELESKGKEMGVAIPQSLYDLFETGKALVQAGKHTEAKVFFDQFRDEADALMQTWRASRSRTHR